MFAAPEIVDEVVAVDEQRQHLALERHRERQPAPRLVETLEEPAERSSTHLAPSYCHARPRRAYAAVCSSGDRECAIGDPSTASRAAPEAQSRRVIACSRHHAQLVDAALVLVDGLGEHGLSGVEVHGHEEDPRAVGRVQRRVDREVAGARDRPIGRPACA